MRPPVGVPALSRRSRILLIAGGVLLAVMITGSRLLETYVDWLWFGEVGYREVFRTVLFTRGALLVLVGLLVGGALSLNLWLAYRARPVFVPVVGPDDPVARYRTAIVARLRLVGIGLPVIVGVLAGLAGQGDWQVTQMFLNGQSFGVTDPQFNRDVSFYAFDLPFYRMVLDWLFVAVVVSFLAAVVTHYIFGGIRLAGRGGQLAGPARIQLAVLAGTFVLLKAVAYYFDRFGLLFSGRNEKFTGASYTDLNAVLPAKLILLCIAVFCALAFFTGAVVKNLQLPAIAIVLMVLSSVLVGAAWPAVLEQFSVKPNADRKEALSIERNIAATRQAYGLTDDKVNYVPYQGTAQVSPAEVARDTSTIPNIRLLDPSVLAKTFTQQRQLRNFYGFPDKLDVDRYTIDGETRDYVVAVREMNTLGLAPNQRDWINRHLIYTHGNGFVAAPANTIDSAVDDSEDGAASASQGGFPVYTVSDLTTKGAIQVDQPRTYYGELVTDYAIVGATEGQAAREYDTDSTQYTYDGKGGVGIGGTLNRLAFSTYYRERNILFSSAIGDNSRIIYNRNPRDRVEAVAPWLTVDGDPYPAVVDGRIIWIVDGYTTLDRYPYANRTSLQDATQDTLVGVAGQPNRLINYIRNSVKATVDAYDGTVTLYAFDESDPVLRTWMGVFPGTVKPASDISDDLRAHFRYPEDLFKVQRELLSRYHVSNPGEFYSAVSFWDVPTDPTKEGATTATAATSQPPYYVLAGNPETGGEPSFQLTSALVSLQRQFLSAYVSASSDPDTYGKITVLQLPSDTQTKGPQQVQNDFISSPDVSREINILKQQTKVINGNLLTLPVAGGLLYVEPVYLERTGQESSYPQLARVLASYNGRVGYAPTLGEALEQVFGAGAGESTTDPGDGGTSTSPPTSSTTTPPTTTTSPSPPAGGTPDLDQAVRDISAAIAAITDAQQKGDFEALGRAYAALKDATDRFERARAGSGGSPPTTTAGQQPSPTPGG
ncbi:MAG TPA: UPF0182 family protein [Pseudonocardiaceae bacterium]